jgi:hypothetical protein
VASNFLLELDTTAPAGVTVSIDSGAASTGTRDVSVAIASSSPDAAQVKIYGDVDDSFAPSQYRASEANAPWITLASPHAVRLSTGDGTKTIRVKVRDDVDNPSGEQTDTITLDTSAAVPNVTAGPTPAKISKQAGKDSSQFTWTVDTTFTEYKVKLVPGTGSTHDQGTQIPTAGGSTFVAASGSFPAATPITTTIKGADLEAAAGSDGSHRIKVFVFDGTNWSTV